MKKVVDALTVLAVIAIMVGGSMLDSPNIVVPLAIILPGMIWTGIRIVITEVCK